MAERYRRLQAKERAPEVIDAAAHARFLSAQAAFDDFMRIRFDSARQAQLVSLLKAKNARLSRLLEAYGEVVAIGSPLWSEAAFERLGEAYRNFNKGLLEAPMPRGLDAEQQELYRTTLESQALPLEDKATEAFAKAADVSRKSGVYSEWVVRAQDSLREYQPDAFGEAHRPAPVEAAPFPAVAPELRVEADADLRPASIYPAARQQMLQRRWEEAAARLDAHLAREPGDRGALFDAGFVAARRGDARAAAGFYRKLLARDPSHLAAALDLALLVPPEEAESVLRRALRGRPADPRLLDALAAALRAQKKLDEAEAVVRQVLERHPRAAPAYRNLAAIEADRGRVLLAASALENARRLDPHDARILNGLGLLAMRRGDLVAARAAFEQASREDAALAAPWANLGALALAYRDYAAAAEAYAKAAELDPTRWETQLARGWALEGLGKFAEARAAYDRVLALSPRQDDALYGKAAALKGSGDSRGRAGGVPGVRGAARPSATTRCAKPARRPGAADEGERGGKRAGATGEGGRRARDGRSLTDRQPSQRLAAGGRMQIVPGEVSCCGKCSSSRSWRCPRWRKSARA